MDTHRSCDHMHQRLTLNQKNLCASDLNVKAELSLIIELNLKLNWADPITTLFTSLSYEKFINNCYKA